MDSFHKIVLVETTRSVAAFELINVICFAFDLKHFKQIFMQRFVLEFSAEEIKCLRSAVSSNKGRGWFSVKCVSRRNSAVNAFCSEEQINIEFDIHLQYPPTTNLICRTTFCLMFHVAS